MSAAALSRGLGAVVCAGLLFIAPGCAHERPAQLRVVRLATHDSLWRVANANGVSLGDLVRANPGLDPSRLGPGSTLRVPVRSGYRMPATTGWRGGGDAFMWPVAGPINSYFGWRGNRRHEGLDLKARRGTPIHAAEGGRVIASGWARGYGNYIKIRHAQGFVTLYAHNDANYVFTGARVSRGQVIARVGQTGNATGPHLHFEIIRDARARDPLYYLPVGRPTAAFASL